METIKAMFWKPDPAAQLRKCNQLIRKNTRELDRHMSQLKNLEISTRNMIIASSKNKAHTPAQTRMLAVELVRIRRQATRLATSRAQLQSVGMQVNEAFSMRKIEGSIKASTGVMKDVNTLVRIPELTGTMRELSMELMKAGIIEEMVGDALPDGEDVLLDDEVESEVDKVLGDLLKGKEEKFPTLPEAPVDMEEDDAEVDLMKEKLARLKEAN
ncbi:hypothetical protein EX30DRAFT_304914 [Ascodesmis nigricans]|uniref:Snf7-domain-containing protein n=1 Tax=Ascodesmis nigricans TaxID=341454 RepID=A0A4S2N2L8_9PEZI|nr:hypothetical protein EX30DRAFT_304914 [Ascodesmis nigricans]